MISIEEFEKEVVGEELCGYCRYSIYGCKGMTSDGNGEPCFPPCADHPDEVYENAYEKYLESSED